MLRVPINKIEPGMVLARPIPVPSDPYRFLLQRDREIPLDLVPRLKQLGILDVWVRHRDLEFLEDIIDEGLADHQRDVYLHVRANFEQIIRGCTVELDVHHLESSIGGLFQYLKASRASSTLLQKLDSFDNYLMSHSTNVCYLALLLGMKLERYIIDQRWHKAPREAKDLNLLGLGCLLHDIGKMRVPAEILNKPGRLTAAELEEMRRHPVYGHAMLKHDVPPAAVQVVLNHHQRWDGTGYPARTDLTSGEPLAPLRMLQIPVFSRIAIVADVYDAATANRCYSPAKLPVQALYEMRTACRGFFDPVVEQVFYRTVPAFPIGQIVTLSDGCEAVVVDFNPNHPEQPKVQCLRRPDGTRFSDPSLEEIDLAFDVDRQITAVNGVDVRPFLTATEPDFADAMG